MQTTVSGSMQASTSRTHQALSATYFRRQVSQHAAPRQRQRLRRVELASIAELLPEPLAGYGIATAMLVRRVRDCMPRVHVQRHVPRKNLERIQAFRSTQKLVPAAEHSNEFLVVPANLPVVFAPAKVAIDVRMYLTEVGVVRKAVFLKILLPRLIRLADAEPTEAEPNPPRDRVLRNLE